MTMVAVNFAFSGTELIGIAAGETQNPHQVIPVAIRTTIARLIIFLSAPFCAGGAGDPDAAGGVEKARLCWCSKVGIPMRRTFFNLILTPILSAASSGLYASGRMLWSLQQ